MKKLISLGRASRETKGISPFANTIQPDGKSYLNGTTIVVCSSVPADPNRPELDYDPVCDSL